MTAEYLMLWNRCSGGVPGGLWLLLAALIFWTFLALKVLPGTGIYGDRGPLKALFYGLVIILLAYFMAHRSLTKAPRSQSWLLWPLETVQPNLGCAIASIEEAHLSGRVPLRIRRHQVCRALEQKPSHFLELLSASGSTDLISGRWQNNELVLRHHRLRWNVVVQKYVTHIAIDPEHDTLEKLQQHYHRFCMRVMGLDLAVPSHLLSPETLPLYGAVTDSAAQVLLLKEHYTDFRDEVKAASFLLTYAREKNLERLRRVLNKGLTDPDLASAELYLYAASWFAWDNDWDRVIQALDNCMALEPKNAHAWWIISHLNPAGVAHFGLQDSWQVLEHALDLQPAFWPALKEYSQWLLDMRRAADASARVAQALKMCPDHPEFLLQAVPSDRSLMAYDRADKRLDRVHELLPDDLRPWFEKGQLYYISGRDSLAVLAFEQAVRMGCAPEALHYLGMSYVQLGDFEKARWYFNQRLKRGGAKLELDRSRRQLQDLDALEAARTIP